MRRCDIEAATPRCGRRIVPKRGGWHATCFKPMRYRAADNTWICPCGNEESGLLVAARLITIATAA
jgi:hypothetical protein